MNIDDPYDPAYRVYPAIKKNGELPLGPLKAKDKDSFVKMMKRAEIKFRGHPACFITGCFFCLVVSLVNLFVGWFGLVWLFGWFVLFVSLFVCSSL